MEVRATVRGVRDALTEWVPKKYQEEAIGFLLSRVGAGLFAKPGLGKTSVSLAASSILLEMKKIKRVLVCAPLLVCYDTWPGEISKWSNFNHLRYSIIHGKKEEAIQKDADIYIINPEGLEWLHDHWPKSWDKDEMLLIVDESTQFKNYDTLRFKILKGGRINRKDGRGNIIKKKFKKLLKHFKYRYILTGTPVAKRYMDLWSQIYIIDDGERLGTFISHYRSDYFTFDPYDNEWLLNEGAAEKIRDKIHDVVMFIDDEEHLDLPSLVGDLVGISAKTQDGIDEPIYIELPDKARRAYDELEEIFITKLDTGVVTGKNSAIISTKLRQLANGGVYLGIDDDVAENYSRASVKRWEDVHLEKAERTLSLVEEMSGDPLLITYEYHHDLARLKKVLGKKTPHLGHGVPPTEARKIIAAWNSGDLPALLVQPVSAKFGLNLQHGGRGIVWHSLTWSYEAYYQLVKRLWRQGQTERVFLYHLLARNTIDEAVLRSLRAGAVGGRDFLKALQEYYK